MEDNCQNGVTFALQCLLIIPDVWNGIVVLVQHISALRKNVVANVAYAKPKKIVRTTNHHSQIDDKQAYKSKCDTKTTNVRHIKTTIARKVTLFPFYR